MADVFKDIMNTVLFVFSVVVLLGLVIMVKDCMGDSKVYGAEADTVQTWDQAWEDKKDPEKFKSPGDGVKNGKGWCLNPKNKCATSIPKRLQARMETYGGWFEQYAEGLVPAHLGLTTTTEAPAGPSQCSPDSVLRECGLFGIKWQQAKECDVNVCDPEASTWCASRGGNARRIATLKKYPQLAQAPPMDQYIIGGLGGGIGHTAYVLLDKSGALDLKPDGTLKWESPYDRLLKWYGSAKQKPGKVEEMIMFGRITSYKVGFRIARPLAVMQHLMNYYGVDKFEDMPRGAYKISDRPAHLPTYPGDKLHGKCNNFEEMLAHVPDSSGGGVSSFK